MYLRVAQQGCARQACSTECLLKQVFRQSTADTLFRCLSTVRHGILCALEMAVGAPLYQVLTRVECSALAPSAGTMAWQKMYRIA